MRVPAWEGNWKEKVYDRVFKRDFPNLTVFAESRPTATLEQLAQELGPENEVAPVQLEWLLRQEAQEAGRIQRFSRAALVRQVHQFFPAGWMCGERSDWNRAGVYATWRGRIGRQENAKAAETVFDSLERIAPVGWLPLGPDDPIILQAFREGQFPEDADTGARGEPGGAT